MATVAVGGLVEAAEGAKGAAARVVVATDMGEVGMVGAKTEGGAKVEVGGVAVV